MGIIQYTCFIPRHFHKWLKIVYKLFLLLLDCVEKVDLLTGIAGGRTGRSMSTFVQRHRREVVRTKMHGGVSRRREKWVGKSTATGHKVQSL